MSNKYNYKFTAIAEQDIDSVFSYISENLGNKKAANDLFVEIQATIEKICLFPYSFSDATYYFINDKNIRRAVIGNYVLIYEIIEEQNQINVLRFRYAKMAN